MNRNQKNKIRKCLKDILGNYVDDNNLYLFYSCIRTGEEKSLWQFYKKYLSTQYGTSWEEFLAVCEEAGLNIKETTLELLENTYEEELVRSKVYQAKLVDEYLGR